MTKLYLRSYEAVVDGIASLIGPFCEIVLHSLEDLNTSAIKIANGENTGRQVGSPITDLALKMLRDIEGSERNFSRSYFTRAKGGVLMKSITVAIRNGENRVIGLLCINQSRCLFSGVTVFHANGRSQASGIVSETCQ